MNDWIFFAGIRLVIKNAGGKQMLLTVDNSDAIATVKVKLQNLTGNSFRIRFCIINSNLGAIHELTFKGELLSYIKYKCFVFK